LCNLGLVAGGDRHGPVGVGVGHHGETTKTGLDVLAGHGVALVQHPAELAFDRSVHGVDRMNRIGHAQCRGRVFCIGQRMLGGKPGRHRYAGHVFGTHRCRSNTSSNGGINAA